MHTGEYVRLSGADTMVGDLNLFKDGTADVSSHGVVFTSNTLGADFSKELNMSQEGNLSFDNHKVWHDGNDGDQSGLDSDLLDGQHGTYYLNYDNFTNTPTKLSDFTDDVVSGNYVDKSGDFMGGNLTFNALNPVSVSSDSASVNFVSRAVSTNTSYKLDVNTQGILQYEDKDILYQFDDTTGKFLYNTQVRAKTGDLIIDLD